MHIHMAMASRACSLLVRIAYEYHGARIGLSNENSFTPH
jgi:hypothetical protein